MIFKFLILLIVPFSFVVDNELLTFRKMYTEAVENKDVAEDLVDFIKAKPVTPLATGYLGAVHMILAKHALNPVRKLSYFRTGRTYLERSIRQKPGDAELRLLRYTIQVSAPAFLGYNSEVSSDKAFLLKSLQTGKLRDEQLRKLIANFIAQQKNTASETQILRKHL